MRDWWSHTSGTNTAWDTWSQFVISLTHYPLFQFAWNESLKTLLTARPRFALRCPWEWAVHREVARWGGDGCLKWSWQQSCSLACKDKAQCGYLAQGWRDWRSSTLINRMSQPQLHDIRQEWHEVLELKPFILYLFSMSVSIWIYLYSTLSIGIWTVNQTKQDIWRQHWSLKTCN